MRVAHGYRTASREAYNKFKSLNPKIVITFEQYKKIIYTYNELIAEYLLETGNEFKMPFGLGVIVINRYKPKTYVKSKSTGEERVNLGIDWKETKKHGKYIYHLNSHTDGYKYYFFWNCYTSKIKQSIIWKYEMARVHSRKLKSLLKEPNSKYKHIYKSYTRPR